jgi:hypothetical protein
VYPARLFRTEPSVFSVGGIQSSVATPVEGLLDLPDVLEFVEVLSLAATAVVELDEGTTATGVSVAEVRSTTPVFGDTRLGIVSAPADAVPELLDPSPVPQAAKPNVKRLHNTTVRMCARTTKADLFIDHYPG